MSSLLYGPFSQLLPLTRLPDGGHIDDSQLSILEQAGILVKEGFIEKIGNFEELVAYADAIVDFSTPAVCLPGFIDAHTHLCFSGERSRDYALRLQGKSYQEIAQRGGGILDTVRKTRAAEEGELLQNILQRIQVLHRQGVTTCEAKSGYELTVAGELRTLKLYRQANLFQNVLEIIPTCLGAHTCPEEYSDKEAYLDKLIHELLPAVQTQHLAHRVDIFVEPTAFPIELARRYLLQAKEMGFSLTVHADQFNRGSAVLAAEVGAMSADHLEQSKREDFQRMHQAGVIPVFLPGATLGLGMPFPAVKTALDEGLAAAIASDWNPGSAPRGDLLTLAAFLGAAEKLTVAETFAAITVRAAKALGLTDRGELSEGKRADFAIFPCRDFREILYYQGAMNPSFVISAKTTCKEPHPL